MQEVFKDDVEKLIAGFKGAYKLVDFGFPENDYLNYGFWLELKMNFPVKISSFKLGVIDFIIKNDTIFVSRGYLNEIERGLMMVYANYVNLVKNSTN